MEITIDDIKKNMTKYLRSLSIIQRDQFISKIAKKHNKPLSRGRSNSGTPGKAFKFLEALELEPIDLLKSFEEIQNQTAKV